MSVPAKAGTPNPKPQVPSPASGGRLGWGCSPPSRHNKRNPTVVPAEAGTPTDPTPFALSSVEGGERPEQRRVMDAKQEQDPPAPDWSEDDPAMRKQGRAARKRRRMKVDGASVKNMLRIIGERARKIGGKGG